GYEHPSARAPVLRGAAARGLPVAGPRRVAVADHGHLHADPFSGGDALPEARVRRPPMSRGKIRVLVVDDSAFVRQALTRMLSTEPDIEVVGVAVDGRAGLEKAHPPQPPLLPPPLP